MLEEALLIKQLNLSNFQDFRNLFKILCKIDQNFGAPAGFFRAQFLVPRVPKKKVLNQSILFILNSAFQLEYV